MSWFKVDDQLAFNAKIVAAGNEAMGLWVRAGSWSAAQLTNGFIPEHMAIAMANGMANAMANGMAKPCGADALVMAGLWDEVDGGYQFHDWAEFQPSAEAEKEKRKARSLAGQKGAAARWNGKTDGKRHSKPHGKSHGKPMANECDLDAPTRPDPTPTTPKGVESGHAQAKPEARKKPKRPIPVDWAPTDKHITYADDRDIDVDREAETYRAHAEANDRRLVDWDAGFRQWLTNAKPRSTGRPSERDSPRTFGQMKHDNNLALWAQVQAEEEGNEEWPRQLGA